MPTETMAPKERWLAVLNREKPDRVPMDYWVTEKASAKLVRPVMSGIMNATSFGNPDLA